MSFGYDPRVSKHGAALKLPQVWILSDGIMESALALHKEDLETSVRSGISILQGECESDILSNMWGGQYRPYLITITFRYAGQLGVRGAANGKYIKKLAPFFSEQAKTEVVPDFITDEIIKSHRCNLLRMVSFMRDQDRINWYVERMPVEAGFPKSKLQRTTLIWPPHARETSCGQV